MIMKRIFIMIMCLITLNLSAQETDDSYKQTRKSDMGI